MTEKSRIYYRSSPSEVVVVQDGKEIAVYRSPEELVEVHIKGILANDQQEAKRVREIYSNKGSSD